MLNSFIVDNIVPLYPFINFIIPRNNTLYPFMISSLETNPN